MTIKKIAYQKYGCYENRAFEFSEGLNLIIGDNEAGKSTMCNSIYTLYFGFDPAKGATHPYGNRLDQSIAFDAIIFNSGELFYVQRRLTNVAQLIVLNNQQQVLQKGRNETLFFIEDIQSHLYKSMFYIDSESLIQLQKQSWEHIKDRMLQVDVFHKFYTPNEILTAMDLDIRKLWRNDRKGNPLLSQIEDKKRDLYRQIDLLNSKGHLQEPLNHKMTSLSIELEMIQQRLHHIQEEKALYSNQENVIDKVKRRVTLKGYLDSVEPICQTLYQQYCLELEKHEERHREAILRCERLRIEIDALHRMLFTKLEGTCDVDALKRELLYYWKNLEQWRYKAKWALQVGWILLYFLIVVFGSFMPMVLLALPFIIGLNAYTLFHINRSRDSKQEAYIRHHFGEVVEDAFIKKQWHGYKVIDDITEKKHDLNRLLDDMSEDSCSHTLSHIKNEIGCIGNGCFEDGLKKLENVNQSQLEYRQLGDELTRLKIDEKRVMRHLELLDSYVEEREALMEQRLVLERELLHVKMEHKQLDVYEDIQFYKESIKELDAREKDILQQRDVLLTLQSLILYGQKTFQSEQKPDLLSKVGMYIHMITDGAYQSVAIEEQAQKPEIYVNDGKAWIVVDKAFSKGTISQLYLAFRLAMLDHLDPGYKLPFILDEAFVHWDKKRFKQTCLLIEELAKKRQVFVLTCHVDLYEPLLCKEDSRIVDLRGKHEQRNP